MLLFLGYWWTSLCVLFLFTIFPTRRNPTSNFGKPAETPVRQNWSQSDQTSVKVGNWRASSTPNCYFATCFLPKRRPMLALLCRPWYTFELLIFCDNSTYPGTEPDWTWYVAISLKHHVSNSKIGSWQEREEPASQSSLLQPTKQCILLWCGCYFTSILKCCF